MANDPIEYEEIGLAQGEPKPKAPFIHEWSSDTQDQTITHVASGCAARQQSCPVNDT
jgi:hypothetical protein